MRYYFFPILLSTACGVQLEGDKTNDVALNDPLGDEDGDGFSNAEELDQGSDPYDELDVPYIGGWKKDAECRFEIDPVGNDVNQVADNFSLVDQFGDTVYLHDFCGRVVLLEFSGFT